MATFSTSVCLAIFYQDVSVANLKRRTNTVPCDFARSRDLIGALQDVSKLPLSQSRKKRHRFGLGQHLTATAAHGAKRIVWIVRDVG